MCYYFPPTFGLHVAFKATTNLSFVATFMMPKRHMKVRADRLGKINAKLKFVGGF